MFRQPQVSSEAYPNLQHSARRITTERMPTFGFRSTHDLINTKELREYFNGAVTYDDRVDAGQANSISGYLAARYKKEAYFDIMKAFTN
jgi:hypothetical protein